MNIRSIMIAGLFFGGLSVSHADTWSNAYETVCFWYEQHVGPCPERTDSLFELYDNSDGQGIRIEWKVKTVPPPTVTELKTLSAMAQEWARDREETKRADYEKWSDPELRALVKVLLEEINALREERGLAPRKPSDLKQSIKTQLRVSLPK